MVLIILYGKFVEKEKQRNKNGDVRENSKREKQEQRNNFLDINYKLKL